MDGSFRGSGLRVPSSEEPKLKDAVPGGPGHGQAEPYCNQAMPRHGLTSDTEVPPGSVGALADVRAEYAPQQLQLPAGEPAAPSANGAPRANGRPKGLSPIYLHGDTDGTPQTGRVLARSGGRKIVFG